MELGNYHEVDYQFYPYKVINHLEYFYPEIEELFYLFKKIIIKYFFKIKETRKST